MHSSVSIGSDEPVAHHGNPSAEANTTEEITAKSNMVTPISGPTIRLVDHREPLIGFTTADNAAA
ncbi:hypothetical protein GCM10009673_27400 [Nesterenkonia sandarakina]